MNETLFYLQVVRTLRVCMRALMLHLVREKSAICVRSVSYLLTPYN